MTTQRILLWLKNVNYLEVIFLVFFLCGKVGKQNIRTIYFVCNTSLRVLKVCGMVSRTWWCHYFYNCTTLFENMGKQKIYINSILWILKLCGTDTIMGCSYVILKLIFNMAFIKFAMKTVGTTLGSMFTPNDTVWRPLYF